jgi:hypothetical protein
MRMQCSNSDEKQPLTYGAQLTLLPGQKIELELGLDVPPSLLALADQVIE